MGSTILMYLFSVIGIIIHLIVKYRDAYTKEEIFNWKRHVFFSVLSIPSAVILVYFKDIMLGLNNVDFSKVPKLLELMNKFNQFVAFLMGYFVDSIWKNIEKTGRTRLKVNYYKIL